MAIINGTAVANTLNGTAGNDTINGLGGNDTLNGNAGNDILDGGTGADKMKGNAGNDTYVVDSTGDLVTELASQGTDLVKSSITYTLGLNVENLTLTGAGHINGTGNTLNNVITGNTGNNILSGSSGNDTLNGGTGNDTLDGGIGNDILDGGTGSDKMTGGTGNDTIKVDSTGDTVTELASGGTDVVQTGLTYSLAALVNVENLTLTGSAAVNGTGNSGNNIITGNLSENLLDGGLGNDTLHGNGGDDILVGRSGNDTLNGGDGNDELLGRQDNDTLNGGANEDVLLGGIGNDTLDGGADADFLLGQGGDDTMVWDANDIVLHGGGGTDTLQLNGALQTLDLAAAPNNMIQSVEIINITGSGNNILNVDAADVAALNSSDTVRVNGNAGDAVTSNEFWQAGGTLDIGGTLYNVFTNGVSTLHVHPDVDVSDLELSATDDAASVVEEGEDGPGTPTATGNVLDNDVDAGDPVVQVTQLNGDLGANIGGLFNGAYGDLILNSDGSYTYNLDNTDLLVNALAEGQTLSETFTYTIETAGGATAEADLTITITGANDAAIITGDITGAVEEDGIEIATGNLDATDVDNGTAFQVLTDELTPYGAFSVDVDGNWSYDLDNDHPDVQALAEGEELEDTFTVMTEDGTEQEVEITITGNNDDPVGVNDDNALDAVTEDGAVAGDNTAFGNVLDNDTDVDNFADLIVSAVAGGIVGDPVVGEYGSLSISEDGAYMYLLDNLDGTTDALAEGETATDTFTYTVSDGLGGTDTADVIITVTGANDAPTAVDDTDSATEDGPVVSGSVAGNDSDVDAGDTRTFALDGAAPAGLISFNSDGSYTFVASDASYQHLAAGASTDVVVDYTVTDVEGATAGATLTITVTGANDPGIVTGVSTGDVIEDGTGFATGDLDVADVDDGETFFMPDADTTTFGSFTVDADGVWEYTLNNLDADTDALADGAVTTDTFLVTSVGGEDQTVTITITGANDAPTAADDSNSATEDGTVATGSVAGNDADVDAGDSLTYTLDAAAPGGFSLNPNGSYSLDPSDAAYQHLADGATTDVVMDYTVTDALGATAGATLTITVTGVNDDPVAVDDTDSATEGGAVVTGSVAGNDSDADDGETATLAYAQVGSVAGLVINADGSYSFDPTNAAYDHIETGSTADVVATYSVSDGAGGSDTATLTITVTGINDDPVAVDDTDSATEGGAVVTGSVAGNDSDVDDGETATLAYAQVGTVAGLVINPDGSYTFDPTNGAYDHLETGSTADVVATYSVTDDEGGSDTATLTITVTGINDDPVAVDDTDSATEGGAVVTGSVAGNDSDVDDGETATLAYAQVGTVAGLVINPDGSYTFDPTNVAYDHLETGSTADVVATYSVDDGLGGTDSATLTITVTGINDAPVAVDDTDSATEDDAVVTGSVAGNDSDVDDGETATLAYAIVGSVAGLVINADGSYTFDPSAYQSLWAGATPDVVATYSVTDDEGASDTATLTITVTGINDAPAGTDGTEVVGETGEYVFTMADFGFTDPVDNPDDNFLSVVITTVPADGELQLLGVPVVNLEQISVVSIIAGNLKFVQDAGGPTADTSFTFQVKDIGGTANGGVNLDQSANTLTIDQLDFLGTDGVADIFTGGAGADRISGLGNIGNDVLDGAGGNDTIWGGTGSDLITGGLGADIIDVGTDDLAEDAVIYTAVNEGASAGANTGYDTIAGFSIADDVIFFNGAADAAIDDGPVNGNIIFANDAAANFTATHEALLLTDAFATNLTDADLLESGFTALIAAINSAGVTATTGEDGLIVTQSDTGNTAFYYYLEGGTDNVVNTGELTLLAFIDNALLTQTNFPTESL